MEKWETIYQPYYSWLEKIIHKAIKNHEVTEEINAKWTARTIINLVENTAERFYIGFEQDENIEVFKRNLYFLKTKLRYSLKMTG